MNALCEEHRPLRHSHLFLIHLMSTGATVSPHPRRRLSLTALCAGLVSLLTLTGVLAVSPPPARADTEVAGQAAADQTVSADSLPTPQINGVVWDQEVVGNTVYAVGDFSKARPAGAAPGTKEVPRAGALAYDITTGKLLDWAPKANGTVSAIKASKDGSVLYIGGTFTKVNGANAYRLAAIRASDGTRTPLRAGTNAAIMDLDLSPDGSTLYLAGSFTEVNGTRRQRVAAVNLATHKVTSFSARIPDHFVRALAVDQASGAVAIGGNFTSVNGSTNPGFGLAILEPNGSLRKNNVNKYVRNAGRQAGIMSLVADSKGLYGGAYWYKENQGTYEGVFRASWTSGDADYLADCHGDSYDMFPTADVVYISSHAHDCSNIGGFPDKTGLRHGTAITNAATGKVKTNTAKTYVDFGGHPAPTVLNFYPEFTVGNYTSAAQATWTVEGNQDYVVYGGEFVAVNRKPQQGLARFARRDIAPNQEGPMDKGGAYKVSASSPRAGVVTLSFSTNWDRDDEYLTYEVYRDSLDGTPVSSQTVSSLPWARTQLSAIDTVDPGSTHRYVVVVKDQWGASTRSDWVKVTATNGQALSEYGSQVVRDGAVNYWPLDDSKAASEDLVGSSPMNLSSKGVQRGAASLLPSGKAVSFRSTWFSDGHASTAKAAPAPTTFSTELWFKTDTTSGGPLLGYGSSASGASKNRDRVIYMRNNGTLSFMTYPGKVTTLTTDKSYNDGRWHHVVATLSPTAGSVLYVDGKVAAQDATMTTAQSFSGYWRLAGDSASGLAGKPSNDYFTGTVDEVAVYGSALSADAVAAHYALGTGAEAPKPNKPGKPNPEPPEPGVLLKDTFSRTTERGWGSTEYGGDWTVDWSATSFSTDSSHGVINMPAPKASTSIHSPVVDSTSTDATVDLSLDAVPGGNGAYVTYAGRQTAAGRYQASVRFSKDGTQLTVSKVIKGKETVLGTASLEGAYTPGDTLHLRLVLDGAETTTVRAKLWTGATEPEAWGVDTTDGEASLNKPGTVGLSTYLSASAGAAEKAKVLVDSIVVRKGS